jgi:hypothetical protein
VAEKPSAAKKIAELLSQNNFRTVNTKKKEKKKKESSETDLIEILQV